jgi:hypothetical protein
MKTVWRIFVFAAIGSVIYFSIFGSGDIQRVLDSAQGLVQQIAGNYLKK